MDTTDNINVTDFLPPSSSKAKKRAVDDGGAMQVDEVQGIEGAIRTNAAPRSKKRRNNNIELRKIQVPPHRYGNFSL